MDYVVDHALAILLDLAIVSVVHFLWTKKKNRLKFDLVTAICIILLMIFGIYMPWHSAVHYVGDTAPVFLAIYLVLSVLVGLSTFMKFKFLHHEHECMEVEMAECIIRNKRTNLVLGKGLHSIILFSKSFTIFILLGNLIFVIIE